MFDIFDRCEASGERKLDVFVGDNNWLAAFPFSCNSERKSDIFCLALTVSIFDAKLLFISLFLKYLVADIFLANSLLFNKPFSIFYFFYFFLINYFFTICGLKIGVLGFWGFGVLGGAVQDDSELLNMTRRFWVALVLTVPVLLLAMLLMLGVPVDRFLGPTPHLWLQPAR